MLQLHYNWNVVEPVPNYESEASGIELRGWLPNNPVAVPPEIFATLKTPQTAKRLSVGAISFQHCPRGGKQLSITTRK